MNNLEFYTAFSLGWLNAWIPAVLAVISQIVFMMLSKEGGKRAADMSWYNNKDKRNAALSSLFQILLIIISLFVPLKIGTIWFSVGAIIYLLAILAYIFSLYAFATTQKK